MAIYPPIRQKCYRRMHKFIALQLLPYILNGQQRAARVIDTGMFAVSLQPQIFRYHLQCSITQKQTSRERKSDLKFEIQ